MLPPLLPQVAEGDPIHCVECGRIAQGTADHWRAFIAGGFDDEPLELGVFCPDCALREAGLAA